MRASAHFSTSGLYRYELRRQWNEHLPPFVAIMCNPSIANEHKLDPTCAGVMRRAVRLGYGEMIVLNVGAGINTNPANWKIMRNPIGPLNYKVIRRVLIEARERDGIVVCGWGVHPTPEQVRPILQIAWNENITLWAFDLTKDGHPKHPLYVAHSKELIRWKGSNSKTTLASALRRSREKSLT